MSLNQRVFDSFSKKSNKNLNQQTASDTSTLSSVLSAVSDNKSLSLFNAIANISNPASATDGDHQLQPSADILISRLNLTRKQYYARINRLREAGLICRMGSRFNLTSLGQVVADTHNTIGLAIHNQWKLRALDSLNSSLSANGMPAEDQHKLISALLGDQEVIKDVLLRNNHTNSLTV
jgi:hypothetical protein